MDALHSSGLVTLLFADVEKSTQGHQTHGKVFGDAMHELQRLGRDMATRHGGRYVKHTGDGFLLDFPRPFAAVQCACDIQKALLGDTWNESLPRPGVRIGIHTDEPVMQDGEYTFPISWRTQRIMDAAEGRQILLSEATHGLIRHYLADERGLECDALGTFRLRDLLAPEALFRLRIDGLDLSTRPPRALSQSRHNLPIEKRRFVGREKELADLLALLRTPDLRLVTITGMGGIGKTRLARLAAAQMVEHFTDGVWQVECDGLVNEQEIVAAICGALNVDASGDSPERMLQAAMADRSLLILLDCFERLVDCALLIERLLSAAPKVRCLVTSRKVLRLEREIGYPLAPMPTGSKTARQPSESGVLFVNSAQRVDPQFSVTPRNRPLIAEICEMLEGIPLSILLAAGWLRYMTLAELLVEIRRRRSEILTEGAVDESRHKDMAQVVAGSFLLLTEEEQRLLERLSVFVGGFYIDAAADVCGAGSRRDVLSGIARLLDNSLLYALDEAGRTRYKILDTIREYLAGTNNDVQRCAELYDCRERHAAWYATHAVQANQQILENRLKEGTDSLWLEIGNLRAAISFSIEQQRHDLVITLAQALGRHYFEAGLWSDFEQLVGAAHESALRLDRSDVLAQLLGLEGALARRRAREEDGRRLWHERLQLCRQLEDADACIDTLFDLAQQAYDLAQQADTQAEIHLAKSYLSQALTFARKRHQPMTIARARTMQAQIAVIEKNLTVARRHADAAHGLLTEDADKAEVIFIAGKLGGVYRALGLYATAESVLKTGLQTAMDGERTFSAGWVLLELAKVYEAHGDLRAAARSLCAATRIHTQLTSRLRDTAADALTQFKLDHEEPEITLWLQEALEQSWKEIVSELLRTSDTAVSAGHAPGHGNEVLEDTL